MESLFHQSPLKAIALLHFCAVSSSQSANRPNGGLSGFEWLHLMKRHYKKIVWMNPKMAPGRAPWREAETAVKEIFPMYKLTVKGLNEAMVKLMANKQ